MKEQPNDLLTPETSMVSEENLTSSSIHHPAEISKYKLGIALSGGGARGFAHIGALKAIEEVGLKPDVLAGVSAGSIASTLYASGIPLDEILPLFKDASFSDFCTLALRDGGGLFKLPGLKKFMLKNTGVDRLEKLKIPTYIGATDFDKGAPAVFSEGPLGDIVMASCSIPIVFQPVKIGSTYYVDGGVLRNLPAWTIRDKCEKLIGINCSPLTNYRYKHSIMDIAMRSYNLMAKSNQNIDMEMCDLVIQTPDIAAYQVFNLRDIRKVYLSGYAAAHKIIKEWLKTNPL